MLRMRLLPPPPNAIQLRMMQEENWVIRRDRKKEIPAHSLRNRQMRPVLQFQKETREIILLEDLVDSVGVEAVAELGEGRAISETAG
jgi:hypothetical protein